MEHVNAGTEMIVPPRTAAAVEVWGVLALSVTLIWKDAVWAVVNVPLMAPVAGLMAPRPLGMVPVVVHV